MKQVLIASCVVLATAAPALAVVRLLGKKVRPPDGARLVGVQVGFEGAAEGIDGLHVVGLCAARDALVKSR